MSPAFRSTVGAGLLRPPDRRHHWSGGHPPTAWRTRLKTLHRFRVAMTHLSAGDMAPNFHLQDQNRNGWSLEELRGEWVVLYFYPEDDTPGCTKEACAFRDSWSTYQERGIKVFGVSSDDYFTHSKFVDKYDLPFELLADPNRDAIRAYGVEKAWVDKTDNVERWGAKRTTFIIDPQGRIAKVYTDVKAEQHANDILRDMEELMQTA